MADTKHPAEVLADEIERGKGLWNIRDAICMLRRIPALEADSAGVSDAEAVIAWATSEDRKPSIHAFTAGPERQAAYWIEWAENRSRQEYQRLLDKHNAPHMSARAARDPVAELEAERDRLLADMRLIAGTEPVDATLDPDRAVRIAKAAIAATETKERP